MNIPLVSVIMPTANRAHLLPLAIDNFSKQSYPNKELLIYDDGSIEQILLNMPLIYEHSQIRYFTNSKQKTISEKRNYCCEQSNGSIILHMDDDDFYSPFWITKNVLHLTETGAELTGLSSAYFFNQPNQLYKYQFDNKLPPFKPYVLGATMCYLKSYWEKYKFRETDPERPNQPLRTGEDWYFSLDCENLVPHEHINDFCAIIHGANTSSGKNLNNKAYSPADIRHLHNIMGGDIEKYLTLQGKTS